MNFNSQICTTKEQSERLLALGLKMETSDMYYLNYGLIGLIPQIRDVKTCLEDDDIPAWSLHRLIEMIPNEIKVGDSFAYLIVSNKKVQYYFHDVEYSDYLTGVGCWKYGNIYDNIIDCIEWLIKEGYFNKEYLEE